MPKQTYTITDFSGGMNQGAADLDVFLGPKKQLKSANRIHFDREGALSRADDYPEFNDQLSVTNGVIYTTQGNLDRGIGNEDPDNATALDLAVGTVDTATDHLSWEDGNYDFRYTVCQVLDNGVIQEGPLQTFTTLANCTNINMAADDKGKFTFTHVGTIDHPDHMDTADYEGKLCGRVYFAKGEGQGTQTQVGFIHLCDLILHDFDGADGVHPRPIDSQGTPSNNYVNIEEPPTASSFEMNAGYPVDVGLIRTDIATGKWGYGVGGKVKLGMVTYVADAGYIYRSVPGCPDIFPTDDWIDLTQYGTAAASGTWDVCVALYGLGDRLLYFTQKDLVIFNVTSDSIEKEMRGYGLEGWQLSCKCEQGVVWVGGMITDAAENESGRGISPPIYYFDGNQVIDINSNRIILTSLDQTTQITYSQVKRWLRFPFSHSESGHYIYSFASNTWFWDTTVSNGYSSDPYVIFPGFTAGEPSRYKKIYKVIVHGGGNSFSLDAVKEDHSGVYFTQASGGDSYLTEWIPDESMKVKELHLRIKGDIKKLHPVKGISIIYRKTQKV